MPYRWNCSTACWGTLQQSPTLNGAQTACLLPQAVMELFASGMLTDGRDRYSGTETGPWQASHGIRREPGFRHQHATGASEPGPLTAPLSQTRTPASPSSGDRTNNNRELRGATMKFVSDRSTANYRIRFDQSAAVTTQLSSSPDIRTEPSGHGDSTERPQPYLKGQHPMKPSSATRKFNPPLTRDRRLQRPTAAGRRLAAMMGACCFSEQTAHSDQSFSNRDSRSRRSRGPTTASGSPSLTRPATRQPRCFEFSNLTARPAGIEWFAEVSSA